MVAISVLSCPLQPREACPLTPPLSNQIYLQYRFALVLSIMCWVGWCGIRVFGSCSEKSIALGHFLGGSDQVLFVTCIVSGDFLVVYGCGVAVLSVGGASVVVLVISQAGSCGSAVGDFHVGVDDSHFRSSIGSSWKGQKS